MSGNPFELKEIVSWLRSSKELLEQHEVTLAEIRERTTHVPAASADFGTAHAMGRISAWITGEIDFEVIRLSDAKTFFQHEAVTDLYSRSLTAALDRFLRRMASPNDEESG